MYSRERFNTVTGVDFRRLQKVSSKYVTAGVRKRTSTVARHAVTRKVLKASQTMIGQPIVPLLLVVWCQSPPPVPGRRFYASLYCIKPYTTFVYWQQHWVYCRQRYAALIRWYCWRQAPSNRVTAQQCVKPSPPRKHAYIVLFTCQGHCLCQLPIRPATSRALCKRNEPVYIKPNPDNSENLVGPPCPEVH